MVMYNEVMSKSKPKKSIDATKKVTKLAKEVSELIIDTRRYKIKTDSTKLLENLRYNTAQ
jgi:hypothetical protein